MLVDESHYEWGISLLTSNNNNNLKVKETHNGYGNKLIMK